MLHVHRSDRADGLIDALCDLLADPPADPFARELVGVPTRGMERWLTQRLSNRLGICANVDFPFPRRLTGDAVAAASGIDPDADPWLPERMVWPLLEIVDGARHEPWLAKHLPDDPARRFAAVRHVASLLDRYALHRPALLAGDHWQAELWRRLVARIDAPDPVTRTDAACARLRAAPELAALPGRLSLFGLTRLPHGQLEVLRALSAHRDVHLFLLHPSPALWERVSGHRAVRRAEDETAALAENRLLASWGQDARELQLVLGPDGVAHEHPVAPASGTLLAELQAAVRENRPPRAADPDGSVVVHSCHGRARQVEVVRDAILHLLADDPTLEPRDVIVMCPDIETFAPLIQATFEAGDEDLRVRLADRSLRQTNALLGVVARTLELAGERLTASQLLDLADREPVRRRFRLDDDALARLEDWIAESGIRWGLDSAHRAPFKLDGLGAGTWRAGLDRLLVGVTMTEDERRLLEGVLPLDDVDSGAIDLAGRFAELLDRVAATVDALRGPLSVPAWAEAIGAAADALAVAEPWERSELARILREVVDEASGVDARLELGELRALLADRLRGRPTRANFRTGHLTICTLVPMRSVPHRVVCLLGLDDGSFPRRAPRDGDDELLRDPHVGDRDSRSEDRQLLLDALMAATDRLIVTYTGHDERTNVVRPPAVPVGELLDIVGRDVVVSHPLQPFDPRSFDGWSFDRVMLEGARALTGERAGPRPFLAAPLPALAPEPLALADLVSFVEHPVRAFLRQRLGVSVREHGDEVSDALPVELDALERWGVGQRLLDATLAGSDGRAAIRAEIAAGKLPPGRLGYPVVQEIWRDVDEIASQARPLLGGERATVDVQLSVEGRRLTGTVNVHGSRLAHVTYSRLGPRHRLAAWVRLLALCAGGERFEAVTIGRGAVARIPPVGRDDALAELAVLIDLYDRGMREPLPLACRTSAAYAAGEQAREAWESGQLGREDREPEHVLVYGGEVRYATLLEARPRADERWDPAETSRFGQYARRLWHGLLGVER